MVCLDLPLLKKVCFAVSKNDVLLVFPGHMAEPFLVIF